MTSQTLKAFDKDIQLVSKRVIGMANMVSLELSNSFNAFSERNQDKAIDIARADVLIDATERIIDDLIVKTIVSHQPTAAESRLLISALRINKDLERIGDYATNIANHSRTLNQLELTGKEDNVQQMWQAVQTMLADVTQAYDTKDTKAAEVVRQKDSMVDEMYTQIFTDLIALNKENSAQSCACTHLIFIARSLERIGDHIVDIAEEVLYVVNGKFPEEERLKADESAFVNP
ncbi:MAG: phosphate signaling complex protein PhoU [Cocleimonas sp.]|nr:phosphate signaling complex protein PhoU [Cocleimonas sp.]